MAADKEPIEEDDFTFGELTTEKKESEPEPEPEVKADELEKEPEKVADVKKEDKIEEVKKEEKKDLKADDAPGETDEDLEGDIFADKSEPEEEKKISLKKLAKDLDVDLESDDEDEFKSKFSDKLEKAKQEFKLDGYSDGAKAIIKHLNENGGDIDSFFMNPKIASMQSVLALDAETKVRNVRLQEVINEGKTKAEAATIVDEELKTWSTREIKDVATDIDTQAKTLINDEVKKIVGDQSIKAEHARIQKEAETTAQRNSLKTFIDKQNDFLGLKLTPDAKKLILRDIDNGNFDKVISSNPDQIKFSSYMFSKYGTKIMKKIDATMAEQNRKGYNAATRKNVDALHKTEDDVRQVKSGHSPDKRSQETGSKPKWGNDDFE